MPKSLALGRSVDFSRNNVRREARVASEFPLSEIGLEEWWCLDLVQEAYLELEVAWANGGVD